MHDPKGEILSILNVNVWGFVGIKTRLVINVEGVVQVVEVELFVSVIDQA